MFGFGKKDTEKERRNAEELLTQSVQYGISGLIDKAITKAMESLKKYPIYENDKSTVFDPHDHDFFATLHNNLGASYAKCGKYNLAIEEYNKVLIHKTNDPEAYNNLGGTYSLINDTNSASQMYKKAIEYKYEYPEAHVNLGRIYFNNGCFNDADVEFTIAITQKPNYENAYLDRASTRYKLQRYKEAVEDLDIILRINPRNDQAQKNRESFRKKLMEDKMFGFNQGKKIEQCQEQMRNAVLAGDFQSVLKKAGFILSLDPDNVEAYLNRACALYGLQSYRDAKADCRQILSREPGNPQALFFYAQSCMWLEEFNEAIKMFTDLLAIDPEDLFGLRGKTMAGLNLARKKAADIEGVNSEDVD
jgi:tetratricopeptide (TPR) repeat protein